MGSHFVTLKEDKLMRRMFLSIAVLLMAPVAEAANVSPTKANGNFIAGTGIPSDNFEVSPATTGMVALKARGRDTGQPVSIVGNNYYVLPGLAASNSTSPWWVLDFQATPGDTLTLQVDFNPAVGVANFTTVSLPILDADTNSSNSWDDGDGFFTNPGGGAWSENNTPYVVSQSWHLMMGFWPLIGAPSFNPFAPGEYEVVLSLQGPSTSFASTDILVTVVPEPSSVVLATMGTALCGLVVLRRRRRRR